MVETVNMQYVVCVCVNERKPLQYLIICFMVNNNNNAIYRVPYAELQRC